MQGPAHAPLCSASDLLNHLACAHHTTLDLQHLLSPLLKAPPDEQAALIARKGDEHEQAFLQRLLAEGHAVTLIPGREADLDTRLQLTHEALRRGDPWIYQATFRQGALLGHADFLMRVPGATALGDFGYEVIDTKLARSTKAKFLLQLAFYSRLLASVQGTAPRQMHVELGSGQRESFRVADYAHYLEQALASFQARLADTAVQTVPEPVEHCGLCVWRQLCAQRWEAEDHLSRVANIRRNQVAALQAAGVTTMAALAALPPGQPLPGLRAETLEALRHQAQLQTAAAADGQQRVVVLTSSVPTPRGLARLPAPDAGDLFFDMEGDPLENGGLEYLFGLQWQDCGQWQFRAFWAHDRAQERQAFADFMDFVTAHLARHPGAHVYHYAPYEPTALKRLMSLHGLREAAVDQLLREQRLVDLYRVVREGLRISEPRYSLKNVEHFYRPARAGDVTTAGASIVYYERWRETQDGALLQKIEDYNRDDVDSTRQLRDWLLRLRSVGEADGAAAPGGGGGGGGVDPDESVGDATRASRSAEHEARLARYAQSLTATLPADESQWTPAQHRAQLCFQLLDFHRRADKPAWWSLFQRLDHDDEDWLEDVETLGLLTLDAAQPPTTMAKSLRWTYTYPLQDTKLRSGVSATLYGGPQLPFESVRGLQFDETARRVSFLRAAKRGRLPERIHLGAAPPLDNSTLREALFRFADSLVEGTQQYRALEDLLDRNPPRLRGRVAGQPLIDEREPFLPQAIDCVASLDHSVLAVQGPPGAGKTYTGARLILSRLMQGHRVGITSNSHKAIHNLLEAVEAAAAEVNFTFMGVKKATRGREETEYWGPLVSTIFQPEALSPDHRLVAGTAWLFADEMLDQAFDDLFVDEAGQVALANLVAAGTSARNLILLGDQMQLGQPTQGVHPGRSGESALDYLLDGQATIAPDRGLFLATTWRMHPKVCNFISAAVYEWPAPNSTPNQSGRQSKYTENDANIKCDRRSQ
jgi:predicted RecB family nuclease